MSELLYDSDDSDASDEIIATMLLNGVLPGVRFDDNTEDDEGLPIIRMSSGNKKRAFSDCDARFDRLYFSDLCVYDGRNFERRFRMPRTVFDRVLQGIHRKGLFVQRYDATKKRGISPRMRMIAALRILAYGKSFDEVDELC